ncbi:sialate O-acetylesterase [Aestuariivivens sediminicola]|uniref:sialate O-acetylesterase n=1 Tax=Aestuariivivens sediminicola TaxID=2913560 RepID=UPI001F5984D7|nr:sialate O-acetylesterase [Aestuariivivens sediminicola]
MMTLRTLTLVVLFHTALFAQLELPPLFNDHMVLQQKEMVSIWGTDHPNTAITVVGSWNESATTTADANGKWKVKLKTTEAGGPYTLTVQGSSEVVFNDILMGDVWICSGQSNMEMPLKGFRSQPVTGSNEAILNSTNNKIRLFTVKRNPSLVPVDTVSGAWLKSHPLTSKEFSAVAYFFGRKLNDVLDIPIGLIGVSWGGSSIETWMDKETLSQYKTVDLAEAIPDSPQRAHTLLYNGMIHPIQDYTNKGFLWYQGESNRMNSDDYLDLFPAMIRQWRTQWGQENLPFYYVQIAPFGYRGKNAAYIREAQLKAMNAVKHVGMAVTLDIGDCQYIHPPEKRVVGERLAYWALAKDYGMDGIAYSGPVYEKMEKTDDGKINLFFSYSDNGLISFDKALAGFTIAGEDRIFYPATAIVNRTGAVTVSSEMVPNPVAVRYAFESCPEATLFNIEGLPASSFRTDDWEHEENN